MTSDYVTHVLFQLRWEAVEDLDDYMMGVSDMPESSDDDSDDGELERTCSSCDIACQTPIYWLASRAAQEPKEPAPGRAPPRNMSLEPGMTTPRIGNRVPVDLLRPLDQSSLALVRARCR